MRNTPTIIVPKKGSSETDNVSDVTEDESNGNNSSTDKVAKKKLKIDDAKADIKLCKEYIRSIKGVDVCPSCGEDVEEDSAFCRHCGAKMEANE